MNKALSGSFVLAVLAFAAGCGGVHLPGAGPDLHSFKPRGLVLADVASMASRPSQSTDFDTYIVNDTGHRIRITGARVAPMPGKPAPSLVHVGYLVGNNEIGGTRGWPPRLGATKTHRLVGSSLPTGMVDVAVGITGTKVGKVYVAAGVVLTYQAGDSTGHATAWGGGMVCVVDRATKAVVSSCLHRMDANEDSLLDYIHSQS